MDYFVIEEEDRDVDSRRRDYYRLPGWAHTFFTIIALVAWFMFCLWLDFNGIVVGAGAALLLYLRWRDRLFGRV